MRIIAHTTTKIRIYLALTLIIIFAGLAAGTHFVNRFTAIKASLDENIAQTVIIDAGHGGPDGGTSADDGTLEKDINLHIALMLSEALNAMGVETKMTRTDDISIHNSTAKTIREKKVSDIKNRLKIINETDNSIFVSIHQNHFSVSKYNGTQVFYSKNNPLSKSLANSIRQPIITYLQPENSREIKESGSEIYLLHHAQKPAVMIECGFLSNFEETQKLKDKSYQKKLAFLIAIGIFDYLNSSEGS